MDAPPLTERIVRDLAATGRMSDDAYAELARRAGEAADLDAAAFPVYRVLAGGRRGRLDPAARQAVRARLRLIRGGPPPGGP